MWKTTKDGGLPVFLGGMQVSVGCTITYIIDMLCMGYNECFGTGSS